MNLETGREFTFQNPQDDWESQPSPFGIPLPRGQFSNPPAVSRPPPAVSRPPTDTLAVSRPPVISHYRIAKYESEINDLIQQGYVPFGNLSVVSLPGGFGNMVYAQPMVKYSSLPGSR